MASQSSESPGGSSQMQIQPSCCWYNRTFALCCKCSEQACSLRCLDCFSHIFFRYSGMYSGGNFSRSRVERFLGMRGKKAGQTKTVISKDVHIGEGVNQVGLRIYEKRCSPSSSQLSPVLLFIHGGGFVLGSPSLDGHDKLCKDFTCQGFVVVSVDYRLAPEHPFPAAVIDCYTAMESVWRKTCPGLPDHADPENAGFVIAGDSAGGNLSFVMASLARDGLNGELAPSGVQIKVKHAVLIYPVLFALSPDANEDAELRRRKAEHVQNTKFYMLPRVSLEFFYNAYIGQNLSSAQRIEVERTDRRLSPALAGLAGLPPITLISAGKDPLCVEIQDLAKLMKEQRVPCQHLHYEKMPHGFATFGFLPQYQHCFDLVLSSISRDLERDLKLKHCTLTSITEKTNEKAHDTEKEPVDSAENTRPESQEENTNEEPTIKAA